jgi:iron complex outermembrane receptor protein
MKTLLLSSAAALALAAPAWAQTVSDGSAAKTPDTIEEIVVTAPRYKLVDPSPAAKIQADNHDLPITVDQITSGVLSDRAVVNVDEAIDTVAGVRVVPGFPGASGYLVRGFFESYNVLVDGFRDGQTLIDPQAIDRIDVLKGPPSVLFGAQSPGGVVDIVTKLPQPQAAYSLEALGGSYDDRRFTADLNQPFADGRVLVRLNGTYEDAGSFRDFVTSENRYAAPAVTLKLTDADTLTLRGSYTEENYTYYSDFPPDIRFLALPISFSFSEPGLPQSKSHEWRASYDYSHDFGGGWRFRSALGYNRYVVDHGLSRVYYPTLEADGRTLDRTLEEGPQSAPALTLQEELYGRVQTGPLRHDVVAGFEYYDESYTYVDDFASIAPLDIFNPVYGARPGPVTFGYAGGSGDHNYALYLQDLVSLGAHWKLLAGVRYDWNRGYYESNDAAGALTSRTTEAKNQASPRLGLVYQPVPATSLYFSWSKSFFPQIYYTTANGQILPPDQGEQYEVGAKQDLLDRRLSLTAALFYVRRENVATVDPSNPAFYIAAGEQRSRGVELSAAGRIRPGWDIVATYAYTDAKVTRDQSLPVGDRLAGVPENAFSLWTRYEVQSGPFEGLGGGVGVTYASDRQATLPNTFILDSYARVDALISYRLAEHYRIAVNIKNLNDVRYYDTDGAYALRPGAPRTVLASLRADF